jgi:hypothetical protein
MLGMPNDIEVRLAPGERKRLEAIVAEHRGMKGYFELLGVPLVEKIPELALAE